MRFLNRDIKKRANINATQSVLLGVFVIFASYAFGDAFSTYKDQGAYRAAYAAQYGLSLSEGYIAYQEAIGAKELVHFVIVWISSNLGLEKLKVISTFNGILAGFSFYIFRLWGAGLFAASAVILTNYYSFVLYFHTERLKFSVLLILLFFVFSGRANNLFIFLSISAHLQSLIFWGSVLFSRISGVIKRSVLKFKIRRILFIAIVVAILFLWSLKFGFIGAGKSKIGAYIGGFYPSEILEVCVFWFASVASIYFSSSIYPSLKSSLYLKTIVFLPLAVAGGFLSTERLVMISVFVFFYFAFLWRGGFNPIFLAFSSYFGWKTFKAFAHLFV